MVTAREMIAGARMSCEIDRGGLGFGSGIESFSVFSSQFSVTNFGCDPREPDLWLNAQG